MNLQNKVGKIVTVEGKISNMPWQHLIANVATHQQIYYFDLEGEPQIVIYSKDPIDCSNDLEIEGEVIEVKGHTKRPNKIDDVKYVEYHILVENWKCKK